MGPFRKALRKRAMVYLWRAQQSGAIISISLLGTLTAASVHNDYLRERTNNWNLGQANVLGGLLITMFLVFAGVFMVGFAFDRLKFWKEQNVVGVERNPYGSYKLSAKEIWWIRIWSASIEAGNPGPEQNKLVAFFAQWVDRSLEDDPVLKQEVAAVATWVKSGDAGAKKMLEGEG
jgi:hypothetical protein